MRHFHNRFEFYQRCPVRLQLDIARLNNNILYTITVIFCDSIKLYQIQDQDMKKPQLVNFDISYFCLMQMSGQLGTYLFIISFLVHVSQNHL